jgi:predicted transcriptional regulator
MLRRYRGVLGALTGVTEPERQMDNSVLMELTTDIVSAHVGHNRIEASDVPRLIHSVYGALAHADHPAPVIEAKPQPAASIRSSVKPDAIACLECGAKLKMLKRHIGTDHGLSPADYRARWGLPAGYPMVAPAYSQKRQELAKKMGLGRKPGTKVKRKAALGTSRHRSEVTTAGNAEG